MLKLAEIKKIAQEIREWVKSSQQNRQQKLVAFQKGLLGAPPAIKATIQKPEEIQNLWNRWNSIGNFPWSTAVAAPGTQRANQVAALGGAQRVMGAAQKSGVSPNRFTSIQRAMGG